MIKLFYCTIDQDITWNFQKLLSSLYWAAWDDNFSIDLANNRRSNTKQYQESKEAQKVWRILRKQTKIPKTIKVDKNHINFATKN